MGVSWLVNAADIPADKEWEQVETLLISLHGGLIRTRQEFPVGTTLEIRMCQKDRSTRARVVWMNSGSNGKGYELGFEVVEPGFWDVKFLPDRWRGDEQPGTARR